jgi:SAM-dependent methyltransferase
MSSTVQEREQAFHDAVFVDGRRGRRSRLGKYYAVGTAPRRYFDELLDLRATGHLLELGSGPAFYSRLFARRGLNAIAVDVSHVAMQKALARAQAEHLEKMAVSVMDGNQLGFTGGCFNLVYGAAILHHLDVAAAYSEIARVLRPGGSAVFLEPLGHNPLINLFRRVTPHLRTIDEHPLLMTHVAAASVHFGSVRARYFTLLPLLIAPFRRLPGATAATHLLERGDAALFRLVPALRRYAWIVVLELFDPIT